MGLSTKLTDPAAELVADASAVINLVASGFAREILAALPNRLVVVDVIPRELEVGRPMGHKHALSLASLVEAGLVRVVSLGEVGCLHFEELVIGPAVDTLDDGEAATIAYAAEVSGVVVIDERKALRICAQRFPALPLACSVDIFVHPRVKAALGPGGLRDVMYNALHDGRMGVLPQHLEDVVALIGPERAAECRSLPERARRPRG
jgi:predicted nucleic acid-binding protein